MRKTEKINQKTVAVFGGSGHYGRHICRHLVMKDIPVKVLSRNKDNAIKILGGEVEVIGGDILNRDDIARTLEGTSAVIISHSGMSWGQIKKIREIEVDALQVILETMRGMGIYRLVFISVYDIPEKHAESQAMQKLSNTKQMAEKVIRESQMNWTILGCPPSYELFFRLLRKNSLMVPGGGRKALVCISPEDVGEIAAQAVLRNDLGGKRFKMAGPETIDFPSFAKRVTKITGLPVHHRSIPLGMVNVATFLLSWINPFPRFIYQALKMMNNFPAEIAADSSLEHKILLDTFEFNPTTINQAIGEKRSEGSESIPAEITLA